MPANFPFIWTKQGAAFFSPLVTKGLSIKSRPQLGCQGSFPSQRECICLKSFCEPNDSNIDMKHNRHCFFPVPHFLSLKKDNTSWYPERYQIFDGWINSLQNVLLLSPPSPFNPQILYSTTSQRNCQDPISDAPISPLEFWLTGYARINSSLVSANPSAFTPEYEPCTRLKEKKKKEKNATTFCWQFWDDGSFGSCCHCFPLTGSYVVL